MVREAILSDCQPLHRLLNEIIAIGGTTAIELPLSTSEFADAYLRGPGFVFCGVAENQQAEIVGFQSLSLHPKLACGWADIATFAKVKPKTPGVGTALFQQTLVYANRAKLIAINATIRADNLSGLSYYSKMGFADYAIDCAMLLNDGTPIDRISKKFVTGEQGTH